MEQILYCRESRVSQSPTQDRKAASAPTGLRLLWLSLLAIGMVVGKSWAQTSCTPQQLLNQERYWYFGNKAGIDFGPTLTTPTAITGAQNTGEGTAVATNGAGELLFYVGGSGNTSNIYNPNGSIMANGTGLTQNGSMTQGNVGFQAPGNPDKYFVVTNDYALNSTEGNLRYSVVDMCSRSVTQKNIVVDQNILGEALTAIPSTDPTKIWVFVGLNNSNQVIGYLFDNNGYTGTKVTSPYAGTQMMLTRIMRLSPNGTQLLLAGHQTITAPVTPVVNLFDINTTTGQVTLKWQMVDNTTTQVLYGADFSPDGNLIYTSGIQLNTTQLYQYTITGKITGAQVLATRVLLGNIPGTTPSEFFAGGGQIRRAPNGKMYIANEGLNTLGVINNPNVVGTGANYVPQGFTLAPGTTSRYGLPQTLTGCSQPAARFTFNCGSATATGPFVANGISGQTGTLTIPISVSIAGSIGITVTGTGFTTTPSPYVVPVTAGQTSVTIPVTYDGSGAAGPRSLTLSSPQTTGTCSTTGGGSTCTVPVTVECAPITNAPADNVNPTVCGGINGSIKICGLAPNSTGHTINYARNNVAQPARTNLTADAVGCLVLSNLTAGTYTNIVVNNPTCLSGTNVLGPLVLTDPTPPPAPTASVTSQTICSGDQVAIAYTTTPAGSQVQWTRQPGNMSGVGNILDFPATLGTSPETYTYTASVTAFGCPSQSTVTVVTVNPRPIVTPSICSQTICSGQTGAITFESSIPGSTIHWERTPTSPAPASGTGDISQSFINTGPTSLTYTYKIWATSPAPASCPSSTTITCEIVVTPGLEVTAFASSATVCVGSPLSLSAAVVQPGNYTYAWTGPNGYAGSGVNPTVAANAGLTHSGSYTVVVTDAEGCSGTAVVNALVENCCPTPEPVATVSLCNNETLNLQTYLPAGGTFTQLTGTAGSLSGSTFNGIVSGAGVFKVGYRPAGLGVSCAPDTITVVVRDCTPPPCNYPVNAIVIDASCGNSDGRAELTLGGISENAMTSFAWSNGQVGSAISGLSAGVYSVTATVTDGANICAVVDSVQVNNIGGPVAELRLVTAASCSVNGAASLSLVSGTGPFTVSWTGAATGSQTAVNLGVVNITNLPAGPYVFQISSAATPGCYGYLSVNIPRNDDTRITLTATATDATACASPSGSIVINVQPQVGVSAPFSYSLNGQLLGTSNLPTYTINNLPAGVYTVSASSASGCTTTSLPVIINATGAPAIAGWTAVDPACPTDQGQLVFAGGQSGTTFQVREASTGAVVANNISGATSTTLVLPAGTYITQTVSGTCVSADTLILNRPQEIKFNVQYTAETCADGGVGNSDGTLAVVQITGGTRPYTIVVRNDQGQTFTGDQLTSLPAGNYSVNVTDSKGCSGGDGTLVTVPPCGIVCPKLEFNTVVLDAQCEESNGEATAQLLNAPAGTTVTYQWSNGFIGPVTTGLTSGIYSVTAQITSGDIYNGCKYVETVNVNAIGGPVFTVSPVTPASCTSANGTAVINLLTGTAPFNVSWTGPTTGSQSVPNLGSTTINNLKAGTYVFTVTGAGSTSTCIGIYEVTILESSGNLAASATASAVTGCGASDGRISVNVTGGVGPFTYIVNGFVRGFTSNRTFSVEGLPAGTYYVEVTDRNGCTTVRNNVLINTSGQPPITGVTSTNPLCPAENGTIAFAGTGNASDQYVVTIAGTASQIGQTAGNVAASYSVPGGTYLISRTTSTGCVSVTTVTVTQPTGLDYNIQYALPTCEAPTSGSLAVVQANGGTAPYSVTVTGAEGVVSDLTALSSGSYTVTLGDANGCTLSRVVSLTINACCNLEAALAALPVTNCENLADGSLEIEYSGSQTYEYNLNGGSFQPLGSSPFSVTGLAAGTYTVVIQAVGDPTCMTTLSGTIVTPTAPVVSTVVVTNPTDCTANNGGLAIVLVNSEEGIFQYSIDNGGSWQTSNTFSGLVPGNYTVLVRNAVAPTCFVNAGSFTIQSPGGITAQIGGQNQDVCALNQCTVTITASGGSGTYEYSLDGGLTWADLPGGSITRNNLAPSNYLVVVRDKAIPSCQVQELVELASEECPVPVITPVRLTGGE